MVIFMRISLENNLLSIDNYKQIINLTNDLIQLEEVIVQGCKLNVLYLDSYQIIIQGTFKQIQLGDNTHEIQNYNEKK